MIEMQELKLVKALAGEGSFNKAADVLNMSQPALTKKIARLEDKLGVTLFHRSRRGTRPTVFGTYLLEKGQQLLDRGEMLQRQMQLMANMEIGELRIGVGPVVEQNLLPRVLSRFLSLHPHISVTVRVDSAARLLTALNKVGLDLAVGAFDPLNNLEDLHTVPLADQNLVFATRPGHPLLCGKNRRTGISFKEILDYPLAAPRIPDYLRDWFAEIGEGSANQGVKCENYNVLREITKVTDHVISGPASLFQADFAAGDLIPLPLQQEPKLKTSVLTRQESLHSPLVRTLTELFAEVSGDLSSGQI